MFTSENVHFSFSLTPSFSPPLLLKRLNLLLLPSLLPLPPHPSFFLFSHPSFFSSATFLLFLLIPSPRFLSLPLCVLLRHAYFYTRIFNEYVCNVKMFLPVDNYWEFFEQLSILHSMRIQMSAVSLSDWFIPVSRSLVACVFPKTETQKRTARCVGHCF